MGLLMTDRGEVLRADVSKRGAGLGPELKCLARFTPFRYPFWLAAAAVFLAGAESFIHPPPLQWDEGRKVVVTT